MQLHANAAVSLIKRRQMVLRVLEQGWTVTEAAAPPETSSRPVGSGCPATARTGECGLLDRSSAPKIVANRTCERRIEAIAALRRLRFTGPEIAEALAMPLSTVSGILTGSAWAGWAGWAWSRPSATNAPDRASSIHIDVKKLGRIARPGHRVLGRQSAGGHHRRRYEQGWEFVHVAIDDCTRLAYVEVLPDERPAPRSVPPPRHRVLPPLRHPRRAPDHRQRAAYRSTIHALACRALGIRHLRTRPYRPQTNGKAERFIRTMLGGWAYGALYRNSTERTAALDGWLDYYNHHRRHAALGHKPPIARLHERNNVLGTYS